MYILLLLNLALGTNPLYTWEKESDMQGLIPTPRGGHSSVLIGRLIYIFGGCNATQFCHNDLHTYNTKTKVWDRLNSTGTIPIARGDHSAVLLGTKMIVFGGSSKGLEFNDLYEYNAVTDHWVNLLPDSDKPQGRSGAACALDADGNIFIVGGYSSQGYLNDVWVYSKTSNKWTKFQTSGDAPTPRELHSFVIQGKIGYLYGGFHAGGVSSELYILDIELMTWFKARDDGFLPEAREGHISLVSSDFLFIQGGCNFAHSGCYDDLYVLDLITMWWVKLETRSFTALPPQKERAGGVMLGSEIIIFAGCYLNKHCFNDVIRINTGLKCSCNSNGTCRDGICICYKGYSGHDCSIRPKCKENCLGRGFCTSSAECDCYPGYKGKICEYESYCPKNCTSVNNGKCQTDGTCLCYEGYSGSDCQCSCVHGYCYDKGCVCETGWSGDNCDTEVEYESSEESSNIENSSTTESVSESSSVVETQDSVGSEESYEDSQNYTGNTTAALQNGILTNGEEVMNNDDKGKCGQCVHGTCKDGKCYCSSGYTGESCDRMTKGVALIYASSVTIFFILAGALIGYFYYAPSKIFRDKEEFPLIREKS